VGYSLVRVDDLEPSGPGGAVRFVRRELGVQAFGSNWHEIPPHVESGEQDEEAAGQEGVNVVSRSEGTYRVDPREPL
jgi:hypothetical protein